MVEFDALNGRSLRQLFGQQSLDGVENKPLPIIEDAGKAFGSHDPLLLRLLMAGNGESDGNGRARSRIRPLPFPPGRTKLRLPVTASEPGEPAT
jgi:hypothetical protein